MVKLITWSWASLSLRWCFKLIDPPPKSSRPESRFSRWITPNDLTFCTCRAKCSQNCFSVDSVVSDSRKEALEKRVANVRAISYDDFTDFWNNKGLITSATKSSDSQVVPIWNKSLLLSSISATGTILKVVEMEWRIHIGESYSRVAPGRSSVSFVPYSAQCVSESS